MIQLYKSGQAPPGILFPCLASTPARWRRPCLELPLAYVKDKTLLEKVQHRFNPSVAMYFLKRTLQFGGGK